MAARKLPELTRESQPPKWGLSRRPRMVVGYVCISTVHQKAAEQMPQAERSGVQPDSPGKDERPRRGPAPSA